MDFVIKEGIVEVGAIDHWTNASRPGPQQSLAKLSVDQVKEEIPLNQNKTKGLR